MKTVPVETLQLPPDVLKALREDQEVFLLTDQGQAVGARPTLSGSGRQSVKKFDCL